MEEEALRILIWVFTIFFFTAIIYAFVALIRIVDFRKTHAEPVPKRMFAALAASIIAIPVIVCIQFGITWRLDDIRNEQIKHCCPYCEEFSVSQKMILDAYKNNDSIVYCPECGAELYVKWTDPYDYYNLELVNPPEES